MDIKPLHKLLSKEMSRKEFLVYLGLLLVTVTGIAGIIKNVGSPHTLNEPKNEGGFGYGSYGGAGKKGV